MRARLQCGVRCLRHLARDDFRGSVQPGPVIIGQPQWHFDMENIEQLDEVVRPAGGNRAGAHGVFQGEIPANDPGEEFAEGGVGVRVSAARQRNHGRKLGVAEAGESASQPRKHEGEHQAGTRVVRAQS